MIVAEVKPFQEIKDMLKDYRKVLLLGCGTCVTVCLSGGERQVELLASALRMARRLEGNDITTGEFTILRQCDPEFIDKIVDESENYDAILSMACGAGVQGVAEKVGNKPVLPAMNTRFIGLSEGQGTWVEVCAACGDCVLGSTGGICPVATCPKGILNGPCGGNKNGKCEVNLEMPCAWIRIYEKTKELGTLDNLKKVIGAKDWSKKQRPGRYSVKEKETEKAK